MSSFAAAAGCELTPNREMDSKHKLPMLLSVKLLSLYCCVAHQQCLVLVLHWALRAQRSSSIHKKDLSALLKSNTRVVGFGSLLAACFKVAMSQLNGRVTKLLLWIWQLQARGESLFEVVTAAREAVRLTKVAVQSNRGAVCVQSMMATVRWRLIGKGFRVWQCWVLSCKNLEISYKAVVDGEARTVCVRAVQCWAAKQCVSKCKGQQLRLQLQLTLAAAELEIAVAVAKDAEVVSMLQCWSKQASNALVYMELQMALNATASAATVHEVTLEQQTQIGQG